MPSPNYATITIKCKEEERDEVKRLAHLQGLTIQRYSLKRLLMPYVDRDLEDMGFGLIMRKLREKGYPNSYIKTMCGELLQAVVDAPDWSKEYDEYMRHYRDIPMERRARGEKL